MPNIVDIVNEHDLFMINLNVITRKGVDLIQLTFESYDKKKTQEFIKTILPQQEKKDD